MLFICMIICILCLIGGGGDFRVAKRKSKFRERIEGRGHLVGRVIFCVAEDWLLESVWPKGEKNNNLIINYHIDLSNRGLGKNMPSCL